MTQNPMNIDREFGRSASLLPIRSTIKRPWAAVAACLFLCVCGAAAAEQIDERAQALLVLEPIFDVLDCTQQGHIESGEVDEHFFHLFAPYDPDRRQWASKQSFVKARESVKRLAEEAEFAAMDADGNEKVSVKEYRDRILHLIRVADVNGDGEVTMEELRAAESDDD